MVDNEVLKIIHCADIHVRTYRMHDEYKEVFQTFINECSKITKDYDYDEVRIVIAGDLVHQKITISNEQLLMCTWFLKELLKIAPVVLIAGNHDLLEHNRDRLDSLSPIVELIGDKNLSYLKESKCYLDSNIVWCNYSIFEGSVAPDIQSAKSMYGDDKRYVGLYHGPIASLTTDMGYTFDENHTSVNHFLGCDMVLCGDIHKRSHVYLEEEKEIDESDFSEHEKNGWYKIN